MRPKWVMYAWAGAQHCGLAPVDVGSLFQDLSRGMELSLFSGLSPHLQSVHTERYIVLVRTHTILMQQSLKRT